MNTINIKFEIRVATAAPFAPYKGISDMLPINIMQRVIKSISTINCGLFLERIIALRGSATI